MCPKKVAMFKIEMAPEIFDLDIFVKLEYKVTSLDKKHFIAS